MMRKVRHKNIVQFIGACTRKPNLCIVFEFMSGGSVYDWVRRVSAPRGSAERSAGRVEQRKHRAYRGMAAHQLEQGQRNQSGGVMLFHSVLCYNGEQRTVHSWWRAGRGMLCMPSGEALKQPPAGDPVTSTACTPLIHGAVGDVLLLRRRGRCACRKCSRSRLRWREGWTTCTSGRSYTETSRLELRVGAVGERAGILQAGMGLVRGCALAWQIFNVVISSLENKQLATNTEYRGADNHGGVTMAFFADCLTRLDTLAP